MKKVILMLMLFAPLSIFAQKFGHIDSQALISSLPGAIRVQGDREALGKQNLLPCRTSCSARLKSMKRLAAP